MKAIGIILAAENNEKLDKLTEKRAASAIPIGTCYRSIDFNLSNMSNSGINKVAVITQYNSRSLHDHLSSSKWWNLGRKYGGLFVFSPYLSNNNSFWFRGTADSIYQNISYLTRSNEPYVVITSGNNICKMNFDTIINYHIRQNADITLVYKRGYEYELKDYGIIQLDENKRLIDFEEKPIEPQSNLISLDTYVISRTLLINLLETIIPESRYRFVEDIIIRYRKKLKIIGYEFRGYWKTINSIKSFFDINMDFLNKDIRNELITNFPFILTKPKDEPPVKYNFRAKVNDGLVGSGSILNGYVNHSVIFQNVYTGEYSRIINSIVMNGSYIGNNCVVENAIVDKEVVLSDGKQIIGSYENPRIISRHTVV